MISHDFTPKGVCARNIHVELSDDGRTIEGVSFEGGCAGNLLAISKLVRGKDADEICSLLRGNVCGTRSTSCADQMTRAIDEARALQAG